MTLVELVNPPLVVAAHGTRNADGIATCRALVDKVAALLPDVPVTTGYVELAEPGIAQAVRSAVASPASSEASASGPRAVVVPLMLHTGGHVQTDIPEAIDEGRDGATVGYGRPLLPDPRLLSVLRQRVDAALTGRRARDTSVVVVGRGALVPEANAEHCHLARMLCEVGGYEQVLPAFIQVSRPSVPEVLSAAAAAGATHIVVAPVFLFPGMLDTWLAEQVDAWRHGHDGVRVEIAGVIGACDELAAVVADRYREVLGEAGRGEGAPVYLSGLRLAGRRVLVVGAGHIAERRIPKLLEAGAEVTVVAPNAGIAVSRWAQAGAIEWRQRGFEEADLDGVWFVQALSNDPAVNATVAELAEQRRVFCVRADHAEGGTAFTPATAQAGGLSVGVVGDRDPRRSARVRDELLRALQS